MQTTQTLQSQLDVVQTAFRAQMPAEALAIVDKAAQDLVDSGAVNGALQIGETIPDISLPNQNGTTIRLRDLLTTGPLVINFYRGGWCPFCNTELAALQKILPDIKASGGQLIAITSEAPDNALNTAEKNALAFDVLSDQGNAVTRLFGLELTLPEALRHLYVQFGIDLPAINGDDSFTLPMPAVFVVDTSGAVIYHFVNADYTQRAEPAEVLQALTDIAV